MIVNRYKYLSKEEKKAVKKEFSEANEACKRLASSAKRMIIICIVGAVINIVGFLVQLILLQNMGIADYVSYALIFIFCFGVGYMVRNSFIRQVNVYLSQKNAGKKKSSK